MRSTLHRHTRDEYARRGVDPSGPLRGPEGSTDTGVDNDSALSASLAAYVRLTGRPLPRCPALHHPPCSASRPGDSCRDG